MKRDKKARRMTASQERDVKIKYYGGEGEADGVSSAEKKAEKEKPRSRAGRLLLRSLLILFLVVLCVALVSGGNFSIKSLSDWFQTAVLGNNSGGGYPVSISGTHVDYANFTQNANRPVVLSDTAFIVLNKRGGTETNQQHGYSSPILKQSKSRFLIYDLGGKNYRIASDKAVLIEKKLSNKILTGAICDTGIYALATDTSGYASQMTVYGNNYTDAQSELFKWSSPNYRITAVALSSDGTKAAAAGITAAGGALKSAVYLFDLSKDEPLAVCEYSDSVILSLTFASSGNIIAIGDRMTSIISPQGSSTDYAYGNERLHSFDSQPDNGAALLLSPYEDGRDCKLVTIGTDGRKNLEVVLTGKAISVDFTSDGFLALTDGTVVRLDLSGKQLSSQEVGSDAVSAILTDDAIYVLGISEIRKFSLS